MKFFRRQKSDLFNIQPDFQPESLSNSLEDAIFEEAIAEHPHSAHEPNRSFVGPVIERRRFVLSFIIIAVIFSVFLIQLTSMQIVHGAEYRLQAENNRTRIRTIPASRGVIYDDQGKILASNEPTFEITTSKKQLPPQKDGARDKLLTNLAILLDDKVENFQAAIDEAESIDDQILLATDVPYDTAMELYATLDQYPGIDIELRSRRTYVTDLIPSLSHVLGYTGIMNAQEWTELKDKGYRSFDHLGKHGLEKSYESYLRGQNGQEVLEVNALGQSERIVSVTLPVDGENLYLSLDSALQSYIEEVLAARMEGTVASRASVIVMDPADGSIKALVSWPAYDANLFTEGIDSESYQALVSDENLPLFSRAISGEFPSGSTIKPVFASGALIDGIIDTSTTFLSTGGISVGPWFFPDWRPGGHGITDVYWAIADSVNTFFYMVGGGNESFTGLGLEGLMRWARTFGFGSPTGIDLPGEADGFLPSKEWKLETKGEVWYIGDTYHVAIGQGDLIVTPLQIARATAVFANGGYLITPHLNSQLTYPENQVIQEEVADIVASAMRQTVTHGSATSLNSVPVAVAGKTGTAQWSSNEANHSWFTGFAPYKDPEIVITVLVEEGGDASLAVPVARDILNWWFAPGRNSSDFIDNSAN